MSLERFFLLDPTNDKQLNMLSIFEKDNNLSGIVDSINEINPNTDQVFYTEKDGKITDCCFMKTESDIGWCLITQCDIKNKSKKRKIPLLAAEYALSNPSVAVVNIAVSPEDTTMQNYLTLKGFECLGDEKGKIIYLKDREEKENSQRMIS